MFLRLLRDGPEVEARTGVAVGLTGIVAVGCTDVGKLDIVAVGAKVGEINARGVVLSAGGSVAAGATTVGTLAVNAGAGVPSRVGSGDWQAQRSRTKITRLGKLKCFMPYLHQRPI